MARGVNKVILVGNLGDDPKTNFSAAGNAITNISVATSESWKDKNTGETKEKTEWHRVVFFNRLAEIAGEYLRKGSKIYLEGKLQTRKWQDNSGADKWSTEIVAHEMQMLDSKGSNSGDSGRGGFRDEGERQSRQGRDPEPAQAAPPADDGFTDDDIPF